MQIIRQWAKQLPLVPRLYSALCTTIERYQLRSKTIEQRFTEVYQTNAWSGKESLSGTGSDLDQTANLIAHLPQIFARYQIQSVLDVPCGDFNWMQKLNLDRVEYLGADIVREMIETNQQKFAAPKRKFIHLNLIEDALPKVDLIFCRDCLVHFSFADTLRALNNMCASGSTYLLTTTFPETKKNKDVATLRWRTLNLQGAPFHLPPPLELFNEGCTEANGMFRDKSMALWRINDIKKILQG